MVVRALAKSARKTTLAMFACFYAGAVPTPTSSVTSTTSHGANPAVAPRSVAPTTKPHSCHFAIDDLLHAWDLFSVGLCV